jgi:hypothetical protein
MVENKDKVLFYQKIGVQVEGNLQGRDTNPMAKGNDVMMLP